MALKCPSNLTDLYRPKYRCGNLKMDLVLGAWNFSLQHKVVSSYFFLKHIAQGQVCCQCFWMWNSHLGEHPLYVLYFDIYMCKVFFFYCLAIILSFQKNWKKKKTSWSSITSFDIFVINVKHMYSHEILFSCAVRL